MAAKSVVQTIYRRIEELIGKYPFILLDFISDHIGDSNIHAFSRYIKGNDKNLSIHEAIVTLYLAITRKSENWNTILLNLLKINASYIETAGYNRYSLKELKEEFERDETPVTAGRGVTPEMMIMYLYYKRRLRDPLLPFLFEEYEKYSSKIEASNKYIKDPENFRIPEKIKGTVFEAELKSCLMEESPGFPHNDEYFVKLAENHSLKYIPEEKKMLVPRGFAFFFINKMKDLFSHLKTVETMYRVLLKALHDINMQAEKLGKLREKITGIIEENARLQRDVRLLRKRLSQYEKKEKELKEKLETEKSTDKDAHIRSLQKELNYAYSRIENLEKRIEELEEAKEINREIKEDVELEEVEKKGEPKIDDGSFIVVSGGRWNSKSREEAERFFEEHGCVVEFIPAEDTIRKQDLIANADLIIFDTSRHAHKYFYKIKQINGNIVFINKSSVDAIKEAV